MWSYCSIFQSLLRYRYELLDLDLSLILNSKKVYKSNMSVCSVTQSYLTLCDLMDCSPPDSSVHRIIPAEILQCVAISSSRGSSWPRDRTHISFTRRHILYHWAAWEIPKQIDFLLISLQKVESENPTCENGLGVENSIGLGSDFEISLHHLLTLCSLVLSAETVGIIKINIFQR